MDVNNDCRLAAVKKRKRTKKKNSQGGVDSHRERQPLVLTFGTINEKNNNNNNIVIRIILP
jgi:hypothetical protein